MHFYISSRLHNKEQVRYVAGRLKEKGWIHTCDWTAFSLPPEYGTDSLRSIGEREYAGIKAADTVIVLTPQGRGTHIELGMALALGKKVYIYHPDETYFACDDNTCAFYWLPGVQRLTGTVEDAVEKILQEAKNCGEDINARLK